MANEITERFSIEVSNGALEYKFPMTQQSIDQAAAGIMDFVQAVGTSMEAVNVGDMGTGYRIAAINLDDTNYVQLGIDSGGFVPIEKILPGETNLPHRIDPTVTLQAKANTGACNVRFIITKA